VSCPLDWSEVADVEPEELTIVTVPERYRTRGDPGAAIDDKAGSLDALLELARRDEQGGLGDAPWPPHFPKQPGEPAAGDALEGEGTEREAREEELGALLRVRRAARDRKPREVACGDACREDRRRLPLELRLVGVPL
jgi:hypothetical protein